MGSKNFSLKAYLLIQFKWQFSWVKCCKLSISLIKVRKLQDTPCRCASLWAVGTFWKTLDLLSFTKKSIFKCFYLLFEQFQELSTCGSTIFSHSFAQFSGWLWNFVTFQEISAVMVLVDGCPVLMLMKAPACFNTTASLHKDTWNVGGGVWAHRFHVEMVHRRG